MMRRIGRQRGNDAAKLMQIVNDAMSRMQGDDTYATNQMHGDD